MSMAGLLQADVFAATHCEAFVVILLAAVALLAMFAVFVALTLVAVFVALALCAVFVALALFAVFVAAVASVEAAVAVEDTGLTAE